MNAIIVSALLGVVMMFSGIFTTNKTIIKNIATVGVLVLLAANLMEMYNLFSFDINTHDLIVTQRYGLFFNCIAYGATFIYLVLSASDITEVGVNVAEYFALIFFVLCGVAIISSFNGLLMLFIGVEILSIPLYILTGADKRNLKSNEASLKYFLMGAFSTGVMLMGIALMYGATGNFGMVHNAGIRGVITASQQPPYLLVAGVLLLFASMSFKVSAAPFHFWTPDVYDGAPSVFTSFMSTIVKAAGMLAFIRVFENQYMVLGPTWHIIVDFAIVTTLLIGNITAVFQQSVKRMLAYSSIAQAGFMLFALYANNTEIAKEGMLLYAAAYSLATISIFAVLIKLQDYTLDGFNGLAKKEPVLAFAATVSLLSLSGIPLTAGFFAKYYVLAGAMQAGGALWLIIVAVLLAAVSVYYYFRVIQAMYFKAGDPETLPISGGFKAALIGVAALIVILGIWPSALLSWLYF
jgi:NADH-quinone oxidoreductase subunit N